jgi:hypothetical protein
VFYHRLSLFFPLINVYTTPTTTKKHQADAQAERLRIKAELQKKNAKPMSFTENLKQEKDKQKALQKSNDQRRNALCEELGRGC